MFWRFFFARGIIYYMLTFWPTWLTLIIQYKLYKLLIQHEISIQRKKKRLNNCLITSNCITIIHNIFFVMMQESSSFRYTPLLLLREWYKWENHLKFQNTINCKKQLWCILWLEKYNGLYTVPPLFNFFWIRSWSLVQWGPTK